MPIRHLLWIPALLVAASGFGQTPPGTPPPAGKVTFKNAAGVQVGTATITPTVRGTAVTINVSLTNLPAGQHAIHVHTVGKCDPPDFASAGGHFNPAMKQYGKDNPMGAHAGDLPNFEALGNGTASFAYTVPGLTVGSGADSLFHPGGTALVIHAAPDDYKTDPAGNAGARIACGVIEKL